MGEIAAIATIAATLGGSILQARNAVEQAEAEGKAAEFNRRAALNEAASEEARIRRSGRRELSRQFVRLSASGSLVEGSPLDFLADSAAAIELDAVNARIRGQNIARLERERGRNAVRQGRRTAVASLISGGARAGGQAFSTGLISTS